MHPLLVWATRGPHLPRPHGHHTSGGGSGLWSTLTHGIAWGFGTRTGSRLAGLLPPALLLTIAVVAVIGWLLLRNRTRR